MSDNLIMILKKIRRGMHNLIFSGKHSVKVFMAMHRKEDPRFHKEMVAKCRKGFWTADKKGNPIRVCAGDEFSYWQDLEHRVWPILLVEIAFKEDKSLEGFLVTHIDPDVMKFTRTLTGKLRIDYNWNYKGGFGFGLYDADTDPDELLEEGEEAVMELKAAHRVLEEYKASEPEILPTVIGPKIL